MEDRPWTRIAAHGLCIVEDSVLLVRLSPSVVEAGRWGMPGGGLEWGESPEDAVVRELREEAGLDVTVDGIVGVFSGTYPPSADPPLHSLHFLSILYRVGTDDRDLVHELDGTTDLAAWVPLGEAGALPLAELAAWGLGFVDG